MLTIRLMEQGDIVGVAAIERQYPSPWTMAQIDGELRYKSGIALVGESAAGDLRGWCCVRHVGQEAELLKIAVHRECLGTGVGFKLLSGIEQIMKEKSITTISLEVRSGNNRAVQFYKKHGFAEVGCRVAYYSNPDDDGLIFRKEI